MTREEEIRQAATKIAKEWYCGPEDEFHCEVEKLEEMGHWADEHPKNPWISVKDKLPKVGEFVLVSLVDGSIYRGVLYDNVEEIWYVDEYGIVDVTHWMSIPELKRK